jgi:hypothetical protein
LYFSFLLLSSRHELIGEIHFSGPVKNKPAWTSSRRASGFSALKVQGHEVQLHGIIIQIYLSQEVILSQF